MSASVTAEGERSELGSAWWFASCAFAPGRMVDETFVVRSVLGTGGCATVYEAQHHEHGHSVAIKVPHEDMQAEVDLAMRFEREMLVATMVEHENVLGMVKRGRLDDGRPYMAMELVHGESVAQRLLRGRLPVALALCIANQLLQAVSALSAKKVVHRDIKPANVMLDYADNDTCGPRVKLIDFGIAKIVGGDFGTSQPRLGSLIGTPQYMAPEQFDGSEVDERTDVYGCAAVLYEMLTASPPSNMKCGAGGWTSEARSVRSFRVDCPERLDRAIMRALSPDPARRFRSARHMRAALSAERRIAGSRGWYGRLRDFIAIPASVGLLLAAMTQLSAAAPSSGPAHSMPKLSSAKEYAR